MATQSQAPATEFKINLNIDPSRNCVDAHGTFENQMVVGNTARFVTGAQGHVVITFTPIQPTMGANGPVPSNLLPFGKYPDDQTIEDPDPNQPFTVVNSCRAMMEVTITTSDNKTYRCPKDKMGQWGTTVCTGGGANPVTCH